MMRPRAMLMRKHFWPVVVLGWAESCSNSSVEKRLVVEVVRGRLITRMSRCCERNTCKSVLVVPLNHAVGIVPEGSPVPSTI